MRAARGTPGIDLSHFRRLKSGSWVGFGVHRAELANGEKADEQRTMTPFLRTYSNDSDDLQARMDVAVVIPTLLRPSLARALRSVFEQKFSGRIQVLIGVDRPDGDISVLDAACAGRPASCFVQVLYPGYSTSVRNGGICPSTAGGVLRCVLTYLANSRYVAYLDDDNWWDSSHLGLMRRALDEAPWAFALRWFVHPASGLPVAVDSWESVGTGRGVFAARFGGFVDPSCMMINKTACPEVAPAWNYPLLPGDGGSSDRRVFQLLSKRHPGVGTGAATVYYRMNPADSMHKPRLRHLGNLYDDAGRV